MQKITIVAKFPGTSTEYHYLVPDGDEPMVGDAIITSTSSQPHDDFCEEEEEGQVYLPPTPIDITPKRGVPFHRPWLGGKPDIVQVFDRIKFATVIAILPAVSDKATKAYIMLMPRALVAKRISDNKSFAKRVADRKMAERRLKALVEERNNRDVYEKLAKENPEAAELIKLLDEPI